MAIITALLNNGTLASNDKGSYWMLGVFGIFIANAVVSVFLSFMSNKYIHMQKDSLQLLSYMLPALYFSTAVITSAQIYF